MVGKAFTELHIQHCILQEFCEDTKTSENPYPVHPDAVSVEEWQKWFKEFTNEVSDLLDGVDQED